MTPLDVLKQANNINNFRRLNIGSCYHCLHLKTDLRKWYCEKHNIDFGIANGIDETQSISLQAEFICDEFEEM